MTRSESLDAEVRRIVDAAPPLTDMQRVRIAEVFARRVVALDVPAPARRPRTGGARRGAA